VCAALPRTSQGPLPRHHVRHVPRQSSVANLGNRLSGGGGAAPRAGGPLVGSGVGLLDDSAQLRRQAGDMEALRCAAWGSAPALPPEPLLSLSLDGAQWTARGGG
jgi:hypothetical protein